MQRSKSTCLSRRASRRRKESPALRAVSAALALGLAATCACADFSAKFDRFKGRTELEAPSADEVKRRAEMNTEPVAAALTFFAGEKPTSTPADVMISFRSISPGGWQFLQCHNVDGLVDGKPFPLSAPRHQGAVISAPQTVFESVSIVVPWKSFARIAKASKVEFRICTTEISVPERDLADWRRLIEAGTPASE